MHPFAGVLSGHAHYLHWGVIQISLTNFVIIVVMVLLFIAALVVPFPGSREHHESAGQHGAERRDVSD